MTDREEFVGRMSLVSRLPQYLVSREYNGRDHRELDEGKERRKEQET